MVLEIHEDQPLVEPAVTWVRQIHVPMAKNTALGAQADYPPRIINTEEAQGILKLPPDFTTMAQCIFTFFPATTGNRTVSYTLWAGKCGESYTAHTATAAFVHAATQNIVFCFDLLASFPAFFAALEAGDYLRVRALYQTAATYLVVYGLDVVIV